MKSPIEIMLDKVDWKPIKRHQEVELVDTAYPVATHSGILKIGDIELKVYQLSDGQRVIDQESFLKFFKVMES